jgi:hypothetical protein
MLAMVCCLLSRARIISFWPAFMFADTLFDATRCAVCARTVSSWAGKPAGCRESSPQTEALVSLRAHLSRASSACCRLDGSIAYSPSEPLNFKIEYSYKNYLYLCRFLSMTSTKRCKIQTKRVSVQCDLRPIDPISYILLRPTNSDSKLLQYPSYKACTCWCSLKLHGKQECLVETWNGACGDTERASARECPSRSSP